MNKTQKCLKRGHKVFGLGSPLPFVKGEEGGEGLTRESPNIETNPNY